MKIVELFSGIGSQAKALKKLEKLFNTKVEIIKTSEWDIHSIIAYDLIHNKQDHSKYNLSTEEMIHELSRYNVSYDGKKAMTLRQLKSLPYVALSKIYHSIKRNKNLVDIERVKGEDIPNDIDILTYSFPCQDLSNVGSFHGYNNGINKNIKTRSGLLWQVERILDEKYQEGGTLPKFLLMENVTSLISKRHLKDFDEWTSKLEELGYYNKIYKLNALNFGIPQHRNRVIMISTFVGKKDKNIIKVKQYFEENDLEKINNINKFEFTEYSPLKNFLRLDYSDLKIFNEALHAQPNDTSSRRKIWSENSQILNSNKVLKEKVQTITTKQDRHPNSGNIYFKYNDKSNFRFLTPRECFLLMGFEETDFEVLIENNFKIRKNSDFFTRDALYKLAGNSIVVNVLEGVFYQIFELNRMLNE